MHTLNLSTVERSACSITYNVNRFEVYTSFGTLIARAFDKPTLKEQLKIHAIVNPTLDSMAQRKYLLS